MNRKISSTETPGQSEHNHRTIRNPQQIENSVRMPVMHVHVPRFGTPSVFRCRAVRERDTNSSFANACPRPVPESLKFIYPC